MFILLATLYAWKSSRKISIKSVDVTYSKDIKAMVKQTRKTRKKWQQTCNPQTKTEHNQEIVIGNKEKQVKK